MPDYVLLMKADQAGSMGLLAAGSEAHQRCQDAIEALGGVVHAYLPVTGQYDVVVHATFEDDVATLLAGHAWNIAGMYTETMRAFTTGEVERARQMSAQLLDVIRLQDDLSEPSLDAPS